MSTSSPPPSSSPVLPPIPSSFLFSLRCFLRQASPPALLDRFIAGHKEFQQWNTINHQIIIYDYLINDPLARQYPGSQSASSLFWRHFIVLLAASAARARGAEEPKEGGEVEILKEYLAPQLFAHYTHLLSLLSAPSSVSPPCADNVALFQTPWYKIFDTKVGDITGQEEGNWEGEIFQHRYRVESGFLNNIGLIAWPAGFLLADYFLAHPALMGGRAVVELGTGIGLTSVVCNRSQPKSIVATDFQQKVLENIEYNFRLNGLTGERFRVEHLDWTNYTEEQLEGFGEIDTIIACDTTYIPEILVPFASVVAALLRIADRRMRDNGRGEGPVAYLCQTERHPLYFMEYLDALRAHDLCIEELSTADLPQRFLYDRETIEIFLHKVTLKKKN